MVIEIQFNTFLSCQNSDLCAPMLHLVLLKLCTNNACYRKTIVIAYIPNPKSSSKDIGSQIPALAPITEKWQATTPRQYVPSLAAPTAAIQESESDFCLSMCLLCPCVVVSL